MNGPGLKPRVLHAPPTHEDGAVIKHCPPPRGGRTQGQEGSVQGIKQQVQVEQAKAGLGDVEPRGRAGSVRGHDHRL